MAPAVSAGGIIVNDRGEVVLVTQRDGSWSLPKGHVDPGETEFGAALREIHAETGLSDLHCLGGLGAHRRDARHEQDGVKTVHLFLFASPRRVLLPRDPHNAKAVWVPFDEAVARIGNRGDAERLLAARDDVIRARQYQRARSGRGLGI